MEEDLALLQETAKEIIGQLNCDLTPETAISAIDGWDSVAMVRILLTLECEMNVQFDTTEIANIKTISDVLNLMKNGR